MNKLAAVRLYFPHAAHARRSKFWHRLLPPSLGHFLLKSAHRAGIQQVLHHSVHAGYLPGNKLSVRTPEVSAPHHPSCIELIDIEHKLRDFIQQHAEELKQVRVVLHRCELLESISGD
ncbi:hypothetical protein ACFOSS_07060 [Pseudaeromonas sharmana]|jgi:hypothetical protein|uniref:DUF190 domain-containing protein n=1 Tax=Pseudaeromonas sharmana TaxID=328412 RepID=A0ABV8CMI7_9GAMM